jgi:hypothetical protein
MIMRTQSNKTATNNKEAVTTDISASIQCLEGDELNEEKGDQADDTEAIGANEDANAEVIAEIKNIEVNVNVTADQLETELEQLHISDGSPDEHLSYALRNETEDVEIHDYGTISAAAPVIAVTIDDDYISRDAQGVASPIAQAMLVADLATTPIATSSNSFVEDASPVVMSIASSAGIGSSSNPFAESTNPFAASASLCPARSSMSSRPISKL